LLQKHGQKLPLTRGSLDDVRFDDDDDDETPAAEAEIMLDYARVSDLLPVSIS